MLYLKYTNMASNSTISDLICTFQFFSTSKTDNAWHLQNTIDKMTHCKE